MTNPAETVNEDMARAKLALAAAAYAFGAPLDAVAAERRGGRRDVTRVRQVAMYLAKQLTTRSLPEIGRKFGGRDHTTVMHAVRKVDELQTSDRSLQEDIELLRRMLSG